MKKIIPIALTVVICSAVIITGAYASKKANGNKEMSPEKTVEMFYENWINYQKFGNPITDRIYRQTELASQGLINRLDHTIDSFGEYGGFDPVLCAQDIPEEIDFNLVGKDSLKAIVEVNQNFYGMPKKTLVELSKTNNQWKIDNIVCNAK